MSGVAGGGEDPSGPDSTLELSGRGLESSGLSRAMLGLWPADLGGIVRLDISRNQLEVLPGDLLLQVPHLEQLDCSRNRLQQLPPEIGALTCLRELLALGNHLRPVGRSLPLAQLAGLPNLCLLDLRYNKKIRGSTASGLQLRESLKGVELRLSDPRPRKPLGAPDTEAATLRSQLEPLSTPQLRSRLERAFGCPVPPEEHDRGNIMDRLLERYAAEGPSARCLRKTEGLPLAPPLAESLQAALLGTAWEDLPRERESVHSVGYFVVKRASPGAHAHLLGVAVAALQSVDPNFASCFSAIAVSRGFQGSPHIDSHDIDTQWAFCCGSFSRGGVAGRLCVEAAPREVVAVDTFLRMAKVDGRFPHWVSPYEGERFSIIWFRTEGAPIAPTKAVFG